MNEAISEFCKKHNLSGEQIGELFAILKKKQFACWIFNPESKKYECDLCQHALMRDGDNKIVRS